MTNFEKIVKDGDVDHIIEIDGLGCALYEKREGGTCYGDCGDCEQESWQWLQEEYKVPELKNGEGLKAGEIIEVFSGDGWSLREFLTYYNGLFWCIRGSSTHEAVGWEHARIPEKGE